MQPASIWISVDKEDRVYQCGEKIKGTLGTDIYTPLLVAGIEIRFHGVARACWREAPYNGRKSSEVEHEKEEIYFDDRFCLWGSVNSTTGWDSREILPVGRHVFPFQYRLPANQPTSFECVNGAVRYSMHGLIIVPDGQHISTDQNFTVLKLDNLSKEGLNEALEDCIERSLTGRCCRIGRVSCSLSLPKRFFVPGEAITVKVMVENSSNKRCGRCFVHLNQLVTFGGVHRYSVVIASVEVVRSVACGEKGQWVEPLVVPSTCPTVLDPSQLIVAAYCVSLEVDYCDELLHAAVPILVTSQPDDSLGNSPWHYQVCEHPWSSDDELSDESDNYGAIGKKRHVTFLPKYKYYNIDNGRVRLRQLQQSPGVKRRHKASVKVAPATSQFLMSAAQLQLHTALSVSQQSLLNNTTPSQYELQILSHSISDLQRQPTDDVIDESLA